MKQYTPYRTRTRTGAHPYGTNASVAGRRGGLRAESSRTKKQGPNRAAARRQPTALSVISPIKEFFFLSMCFFLPGVPVTAASRLPGVELAVYHISSKWYMGNIELQCGTVAYRSVVQWCLN